MRSRSWRSTDKSKNSSQRGGRYLPSAYPNQAGFARGRAATPRAVSKMPATCIVVPDLKSSPGPQPGQGADKIYPEKFSRTPESSAKKVLHRGRAGVRPGVRESFLEEAAPVPNCRAVKRGRNQAGRGRWEGAPGGAQARRLAKPWHAWGRGRMRAWGRAGTGGGQPGAPACLYLVCPGRGGRGLPF